MLDFYHSLEPVTDFREILNPVHYRPVPTSWIIAVTDVVQSTAAIDRGEYKQVNVAGSLPVMALANLLQGLEFPFAFGGDGMTIVMPGDWEPVMRSLLADVRGRVRDAFGLELRAGIVPMAAIHGRGSDLSIGRMRVSDEYAQALFSGDGLDLAERLIKDPSTTSDFAIAETEPITTSANLDGFSCRWQDIPSRQGETVSLIVRPVSADQDAARDVLERAITSIASVLGSQSEYHPLTVEGMTMNTARSGRELEAGAITGTSRGLRRAIRLIQIRIEMFFTSLIIAWKIPLRRGKKRVDQVRESNVLSSDYRKFDGTLKMVIATTTQQRETLSRALDAMRQDGEIYYGTHVSDRALMTCYIHFGSGDEVHFVDAADGGYALAARAMKAQMAE